MKPLPDQSEQYSARPVCPRCRRPGKVCLCAWARPFQATPRFVILLHPKEARRTIGTARLVQLCLEDTLVIEGTGPRIDQDPKFAAVLADPTLYPCLLFPGATALPVESLLGQRPVPGCEPQSTLEPQLNPEREVGLELKPQGPQGTRRPTIIIVDGTWSQARKMIRTSDTLKRLPCLRFEPRTPSRYQFRRQPALHCLSTIEAVHEVITRLGEKGEPLLILFDELVRRQLSFGRDLSRRPGKGHPVMAKVPAEPQMILPKV